MLHSSSSTATSMFNLQENFLLHIKLLLFIKKKGTKMTHHILEKYSRYMLTNLPFEYVIGGGNIQRGCVSPFQPSLVIRLEQIFIPIFMRHKPLHQSPWHQRNPNNILECPLGVVTTSFQTVVMVILGGTNIPRKHFIQRAFRI